jgi:AcrR family transcriptional regulator
MPAAAVTKSAKAGRQKTGNVEGTRSTRVPAPAPRAAHIRSTQAERREKAEHAILGAAMEIIAERGIDELTLAEAGERAGYSRALPAHYFDSKDAALLALGDFVVEEYLRRVQRLVPGREGLEGFLDRVGEYFDEGKKDPRVLRAFHAVLGSALGKPALAKAMTRLTEETKKTFASFICAGIERGEIRKDAVPEIEAIWILAGLRGVMAQWVVSPDTTPLAKVRDAFLHTVRKALEA